VGAVVVAIQHYAAQAAQAVVVKVDLQLVLLLVLPTQAAAVVVEQEAVKRAVQELLLPVTQALHKKHLAEL
jgi:hypothetical protein